MNQETSLTKLCQILAPIVQAISDAHGICYLVGGSVRDFVLDRTIKDADIEVHQITLEKLEAILKQFGPVMFVGKQFGVLKLMSVGFDIDWSLPRRDSKGRKPIVAIDPFMGIQEACRRRDLTMNAMAINLNDVVEGQKHGPIKKEDVTIIDPFHGLDAIAKKQLRAVDKNLFTEDPLRFFRVMHFIGRFEMVPDEQLNDICKTMSLSDASSTTPIAQERICEEIKKLFLMSKNPSLGFRWLLNIARLDDTFPELLALVSTRQNPDFHPEGNVFEHSMQALDAAAQLPYYQATEHYSAEEEKFFIMLAALCHDLGKAVTTDENLHCYGHETAGVNIARLLLKRLTNNQTFISAACKLVRHHPYPFSLVEQQSSDKAFKRLATKLAPETSLRQLGLVALADWQALNPDNSQPLINKGHETYRNFLEHIERAHVTHGPEKAVLLGRHLIDSVEPGKQMGELLKEAYRIQIDEDIKDVDELKARVLLLLKKG